MTATSAVTPSDNLRIEPLNPDDRRTIMVLVDGDFVIPTTGSPDVRVLEDRRVVKVTLTHLDHY